VSDLRPQRRQLLPVAVNDGLADRIGQLVTAFDQHAATVCDDTTTYARDHLTLEDLAVRLGLAGDAEARAILAQHQRAEVAALTRLYLQ
jgi:hypothetical protein